MSQLFASPKLSFLRTQTDMLHFIGFCIPTLVLILGCTLESHAVLLKLASKIRIPKVEEPDSVCVCVCVCVCM